MEDNNPKVGTESIEPNEARSSEDRADYSFNGGYPASQVHDGLKYYLKRFRWAIVGVMVLLVGVIISLLAVSGFNFREPFYKGHVREYWIAAVPEKWNIVPTGMDGLSGDKYSAKDTTIEALVYKQYTSNWGKAMTGDYGSQPGPIINAQVGDTIKVHFKNLDTYYSRPHSMHPHGVHYTPSNDGSYVYTNEQPGSAVPVNGNYTYTWTVAKDSVGVWVYHDHSVDAMTNTTLGMYGIIDITKPGTPPPDKQMVTFFNEMPTDVTGLPDEYDTINGHAYLGNTPTYNAKVGDRVQWIVAALGNDFHAFHIHGHRWQYEGRNQDELEVGPAEAKVISFTENAPGMWLVHCHVDEHMMDGMTAQYEVATKTGVEPVVNSFSAPLPSSGDSRSMDMDMNMSSLSDDD